MATHKLERATGKMKHLCRKIVHSNSIRCRILDKVTVFRHFCRLLWDKILIYSARIAPPTTSRYRKLSSRRNNYASLSSIESGNSTTSSSSDGYDSESDLVALKISVLGDCQIGKTSFVVKYIGDEQEKAGMEMKGLNLMDKIMYIQGAKIAFRIWDVAGDSASFDQVPLACKDAVAILFMFDLTSRCTLNSIIGWYTEARKWNQNAIPILIGTKFDDFVKLPPDIQWTVVTQARAYARAMKATLFFSSSTHNINVNKIFKFIMAKLFNIPWTVRRNLTIGEPIIDY